MNIKNKNNLQVTHLIQKIKIFLQMHMHILWQKTKNKKQSKEATLHNKEPPDFILLIIILNAEVFDLFSIFLFFLIFLNLYDKVQKKLKNSLSFFAKR